ncbi:hypothetical protein QYF36_008571 [Acer negundo]|nr:hypothetical protein QYF36_008571 [Acer negundo]
MAWCSWLVPCIFLGCVGMFVYTMYVNDCPETIGSVNCVGFEQLGRFSFQPLSENVLLGPSSHTLQDLGGLNPKFVVDKDQTYRLFTYMWLHSGVFHLLANMLCLLLTGIQLEQEFGFLRIGILYFLSGCGGGLLSCLHSRTKDRVTVGASGALFGLLGSDFSELITNWTTYSSKCSAFTSLLIVIIVNVCIGIFIPGVDQSAHYGGFFTGILLGFILLMRPQFGYVKGGYIHAGHDMTKKKPKYMLYQHLLCVIALVAFVLGAVIGVSKLIRGETINLPLPGFSKS